jgi:hypothetical protein
MDNAKPVVPRRATDTNLAGRPIAVIIPPPAARVPIFRLPRLGTFLVSQT